jgi:polar amino acid transport system substrate-binding protein
MSFDSFKWFTTAPLLIGVSLFFYSSLSQALPRITFSCGFDASLPVYQQLELSYRQAFAKLGYEFTMVPVGAQRSLASANSGVVDGECARIDNFKELYPDSNLMRVDVFLGETELGVWSYRKDMKIDKVEDIINQHLIVGFPRGSLMSENYASLHQLSNIARTTSFQTAIKMLAAKRFDLLMASSDLVRQQLALTSLQTPLYKVGVLARFRIYPYIHESRQALLPQFSEELQKLIPAKGIALE